VILDFKFDRGKVWLFIQPENQPDVGRLAELFLYLDEEGKYRGETIGVNITALLAYASTKQTYRLDSDYGSQKSGEGTGGGREGQEGKPKPPTPPAEQ
jgi:hypothetical protein